MNNIEYENIFNSIKNEIDYTIDNVIKRGIDDFDEDFDDYSILIQKHEFSQAIVYELYENHFPPKRHEFELQLLNDIVAAMQKFHSAGLITELVVGTIIGSSSYDLLKKILSYVVSKFNVKNSNRNRNGIFLGIQEIVIKLDIYFIEHDCATNKEIEDALGVVRDRFEPLLKLGGFKCYRRNHEKLWVRP